MQRHIFSIDFDGVIVDSNRIKQDAWLTLFPKEENIPVSLIQDTLTRISQTRYDILGGIFTALMRSEDARDAWVAHYANQYHESLQQALIERGLCEGAREGLELLSSRGYALYLNSGTPETALHDSIKRLKLAHLFRGIFGAPHTKEENLRRIAFAERVEADTIIHVGDGTGDQEAAERMRCRFIKVLNKENEWQGAGFPTITSLRELHHL
ncbi:MAG: hypothetical protein G01um101466_820, partial [Parcubacteria group bacterium Gr01-1014_66]